MYKVCWGDIQRRLIISSEELSMQKNGQLLSFGDFPQEIRTEASVKNLGQENLVPSKYFRMELAQSYSELQILSNFWTRCLRRLKLRISHPKVLLGERPCRSVISVKLLCSFIEIKFRQGCSSVNLLHIFRTPFPKITSGGILLEAIKSRVFMILLRAVFHKCVAPWQHIY